MPRAISASVLASVWTSPHGIIIRMQFTPQSDTRNVMDQFKGQAMADIIDQLDASGSSLHIALENTERDFNMGTIVRTANACGVRYVHIIGRRQWNKRGAMMTDKYMHLHYYTNIGSFLVHMQQLGRRVVAVDNITGSQPLGQYQLPEHTCLVFGQEGPGISAELAQAAEAIVAIEQFGSTRSLNVGVAAGIAMYAWLQQHRLGASEGR